MAFKWSELETSWEDKLLLEEVQVELDILEEGGTLAVGHLGPQVLYMQVVDSMPLLPGNRVLWS